MTISTRKARDIRLAIALERYAVAAIEADYVPLGYGAVLNQNSRTVANAFETVLHRHKDPTAHFLVLQIAHAHYVADSA